MQSNSWKKIAAELANLFSIFTGGKRIQLVSCLINLIIQELNIVSKSRKSTDHNRNTIEIIQTFFGGYL